MREIPLTPTPNQSITFTIDDRRYVMVVKVARGVMAVTIEIDGVQVIAGSRALAGEMLIPYEYLEQGGNFILQTLDGDLPDWKQFGSTQRLFFLDAAELEAIRG